MSVGLSVGWSVGRSVENFLNSNNQSSLIIFDSLINSWVLRTSLGRGSERITGNRLIIICVHNDYLPEIFVS